MVSESTIKRNIKLDKETAKIIEYLHSSTLIPKSGIVKILILNSILNSDTLPKVIRVFITNEIKNISISIMKKGTKKNEKN
ncbi:hypothetical protein FHQ18_09195 [Deferribacter autotrophicus]|uniref:Uncharacterized protein n=1 Tax=Deferribacter autotrophicus TaxID=500465 RepID=A0A5A8F6V4_9BACT|nr:hypothetical protein [Deferribacter autotrophicus]KAA0257507.1 hypothetical protein FHQ18_09195 [Deferribacter autotrophicus]